MRIKRLLSVMLSLCLLISVLVIPTSVSATGGANIKSDTDLSANAGSSISIPVCIENNPGVMGYVLKFKYDNTVLSPTTVTQGEVLTGGNFNDDIEGSTSTENSFKVMWNNSENVSENGILFYLNFDVDSKATGSTTIEVGYDDDDTYNENFAKVEFNCSDIDIAISNSAYDTLSKFKLSSATASAGESVTLNLTVENTEALTTADVNIAYDSKNFEFVSAESNLGSAAMTANDENGTVQLQLSGLSAESSGKTIVLIFKSFDYASSGKYTFAVSCEKQNENEIGLGYNGTVTLNATETSDSAMISSDEKIIVNKGVTEVTVPVYIKHNTGLMGYRLNFTYNASKLAVVSANGVAPFAGNFYDSIGNKNGEFYCIWYANDDVTADGKLLELKFNVVTEAETTSTIGISYSQADTFNEAKEDVKLVCNDADVIINHTHKYGDWTITKAATCTEKGSKIRYCTVCDESESVEIPALGHDYKSVVIPPTCTEQGYTTYTCERCKDSYVTDYVNAIGHDYESTVTKEPTCTEKGIRTYTCKHDYNHIYTEEIRAIGHNYKATVVEPTCTDDGYTTYKCERCNDTYISDYKDASGHDFESVVTKEPSCTEKGVRTYTCKHDKTHTYTEDVPALGHNYKSVVTAPTCKEKGYTTYTCERCKDRYVADYVDALGHDYDEGKITKEPTCTEKGVKTFTCKHDKTHTYTEDVPALGHEYKSVVTPPTCSEQGYTTYTCEHCGDSYKADYTTPIGHKYDNGTITKEPTCTEAGVKTFTCQNDPSHTYEETISALGHDYDEGKITKEPTYTETGIKTYTCKRDPSHTYTEVIPKLTSVPVPSDKEANNALVNKEIKKPSGIKTICNTKNKQMKISFKAVSGAVNYRIAYRKAGAKKWSLNWTSGKTTYTLKNLNSKGLYEFKFAAYKLKDGKWERGAWSKVSYRYFFKLTQNKPKSAKKAIKVSWKKDKSANGYYIFYSTKKSMSGQKKITVKDKNKTSYTIKKLTKGKKYYIRVRSYKVKNGKTYTGELSALKSTKAK